MIKNLKKLDKKTFIYWLGLSGSIFGSSVYSIALPLIAYNISGSSLALGTTFAIQLLPALFFGVFTSYLSDRINSVKLLVGSDIIQSILLSILLFFLWEKNLQEIHIYIISFLMSTVVLVSKPTGQVIIKQNIPSDQLITFNSLLMFSRSSLELLGKIGGGIIVSLVGPFLAIIINIFSFLFSAFCIISARLNSKKAEIPKKEGIISSFRAGIEFVLRDSKIRANSLRLILLNVCIAPVFLSMPLIAKELPGSSGFIYGVLSSGFLLGAILASLTAEKIKKGIKKEFVYDSLIIVFALILPLLAITTNLITTFIVLLIIGFLSDLTIIYAQTAIQENTRTEILGRVSSFNEIAIRIFLPIIFIGISWVLPYLGLFAPLVFISSFVIVVTVLIIWGSRHLKIKEEASPQLK